MSETSMTQDAQSPSGPDAQLRESLQNILGLTPETVNAFDAQTELFGALPELDSMAVATLLTDIEDRFHIIIDDDDVDAETFETYGSLLAFVDNKVAARG